MILSTKEKEKLVLEYLEQNKSYQEIQDQLHISSRDISSIIQKAKEKKIKKKKRKYKHPLHQKHINCL